jgi:hypothetical protein
MTEIRTFCPIAHALLPCSRDFKEYRYTTQQQSQRAPEVLDDKVFHHAVVEPSPQYPVHVLDEREIALVQSILLRLVSAI